MPESDNGLDDTWIDPDDAPEWTEEMFARGELRIGGTIIRPASGTLTRPGRPRSPDPKRQVTLRLDSAVLEKLRSSGPGWQTRVNAILKAAVGV